jgi:hypothetical protein
MELLHDKNGTVLRVGDVVGQPYNYGFIGKGYHRFTIIIHEGEYKFCNVETHSCKSKNDQDICYDEMILLTD